MKIAHVNDKTYINLDKRRSTYLSKTCLQKQAQKKKFHYTNMDYPKKKKKKKRKLWLQLYLDFGFEGFVSCIRKDLFIFRRSSNKQGI